MSLQSRSEINQALDLFDVLTADDLKAKTRTIINALVGTHCQFAPSPQRPVSLHYYDRGLSTGMIQALQDNLKLDAVKLIKNYTGASLMDCKRYIENHQDYQTYYERS